MSDPHTPTPPLSAEARAQRSYMTVELLQQAKAIVRASPLYRRFIDGTPLENDIAVWMADFAGAKLQQAEQREAELHDIISGFDAITDPEEFPELHEEAFDALNGAQECGNRICAALCQAEQDRDTLRNALVKLDTLALPLAFDDAAEPTAWAQVLQICRAVLASTAPKEGEKVCEG